MNFQKPEIIQNKVSSHRSTFEILPLERGYGITLGNSLRRVLLSSIPGCAIYAIRIAGVSHEFTALDGVAEDLTRIILNLKKVELSFPEEEVELKITSTGGVVKARDIKGNSNLKVINKSFEIFNVSEGTDFEMELFAKKGIGFVDSIDNSYNLEEGKLAIDSIFSPIVKVSYEVENTRIGKDSDLDKLILDIETNSTISPEESLKQAANVLFKHYEIFAEGKDNFGFTEYSEVEEENQKELSSYDISNGLYKVLKANGIETIGDLKVKKDTLSDLKGFGVKKLEEVEELLTDPDKNLK